MWKNRNCFAAATILWFACTTSTFGQASVTTFENCFFKVNGEFFFPIGWYGGRGHDFVRMKEDGATVVVQYWDAVMRDYSTTDNSYPFDESDLANYQSSLKRYLDEVHRNGLKAFIHLPTESTPTEGAKPHLIDSGFVRRVVADSRVRDHPALLGWYHGDEVDLDEHDPPITQQHLRRNYEAIKAIDSSHPVFLVFWGRRGFLDRFPFGNGQIYDVLGTDRYMATMGSTSPAPGIGEVRDAAQDLAHVFYSQASPRHGSMLFVCQGYGYRNIDGKINPAWDTLHSFGFRNPTYAEVLYSAFSPIYWAQHEGKGNLGGLLFWNYDYADSIARATVGSLFRFFSSYDLGRVLRQNKQPESVASDWPLVSMMRKLGNTCYLFTINEGTDSTGLTFVKLHSNLKLSTFREITSLDDFIRKKLERSAAGKYRIRDNWAAKQVRVYEIR